MHRSDLERTSGGLPNEASMSFRSSLSMKPSLFWSIMLNAYENRSGRAYITLLLGFRRAPDGLRLRDSPP